MLKIIFVALLLIDLYGLKYITNRQVQARGQSQVATPLPVQPTPSPLPKTNKGLASWYGRNVCEKRIYGATCKTADGSIFNEESNIIACANRFRIGTHIRLCYLDRCVDTICGDRGNFERLGRTFDLTPSVFNALADTNMGIIKVEWEEIK